MESSAGRTGARAERPFGKGSKRRSEWACERISAGGEGGDESRPDSWVDAIVTLLAIVVFGLGWALVELERADPLQDGYDSALSVAWSSAERSGTWSEWGEPWPEALQERSRQ